MARSLSTHPSTCWTMLQAPLLSQPTQKHDRFLVETLPGRIPRTAWNMEDPFSAALTALSLRFRSMFWLSTYMTLRLECWQTPSNSAGLSCSELRNCWNSKAFLMTALPARTALSAMLLTTPPSPSQGLFHVCYQRNGAQRCIQIEHLVMRNSSRRKDPYFYIGTCTHR